MKNKLHLGVIVIFFNLILTVSFAQSISAIEQRVNTDGKISADATILAAQQFIPKFYQKRDYSLAWTDDQNRANLINNLAVSYEEGLLPEDYHIDKIRKYQSKSYKKLSEEERVEYDLLLTDAMALYGKHLLSGKVEQSQLRSQWDLDLNGLPESSEVLLHDAIKNNNIDKILNSFKSDAFYYIKMKEALKEYRGIAKNGGWAAISEGETLKSGMTNARVAEVRKRLTVTGELSKSSDLTSTMFDNELEEAVKKFQLRHNLNQDGAIGKGTLAQMNVPVEDRIDDLLVNLERSRWVTHKMEDDFLIVNIAGFFVQRIKNGELIFKSRVIVGKNHTKSPIFKDQMEYIEMNPTWTLPYSIASRETLPKLKKDPGYLASKNMIIMDKSGKQLDPNSIDFSQYSSGNFPFTIRQNPGPTNALGRVKFMFPNKHAVYLHDTPSASLFNKEDRAFSHGCIRLEDKWELLMNLMDNPNEWNMDKINEVLATGKTTRVNLPKPLPIYILYWTAGVDRQNNVYFIKDVYKRDDAVLKALKEPISHKTI